ncbi:MAG: DUF493 domain-containing protein [Flammeovirgaceae bacterium]|nr:DUF493 domain-containing protein [Flammeovirgaceae bacterium]
MEQAWAISLREKLDNHYRWPAVYTFKFIVPKGKEHLVKNLFPNSATKEKLSANGNYISITANIPVASADDVIIIYEQAHFIEGIIAL